MDFGNSIKTKYEVTTDLKHIKSKAAEGVSALQEAIELFLK